MTIDELRVLLTLNDGRRLPECEEEIFSCNFLATEYGLMLFYGPNIKYDDRGENMPAIFAHIADTVIRGRWQACERVIATDPGASLFYAQEVLRSRFIAGEPVMKKHPETHKRYMRSITKWKS